MVSIIPEGVSTDTMVGRVGQRGDYHWPTRAEVLAPRLGILRPPGGGMGWGASLQPAEGGGLGFQLVLWSLDGL